MGKKILIVDDAAFMRMMIKDILSKNGYEVVGEAENGARAIEKPDDSELEIFPIFESKKIFNLKNSDEKKISVISISAEAEYVIGKKPEETKKKLEKYQGKMQEIIGDYFLDMTLAESQQSDAKKKAKETIKKKLNELLVSGEKEKKDIIYEIVFPEWISQ